MDARTICISRCPLTIPPTSQKTFRLSRAFGGEQDQDYAKALTECETLADLRALVDAYRPLVLDAVPVVDAMTEVDFIEWRKGLKLERRGKFAGDDFARKFGAVLMPLPMERITELAREYQAPFGVTWFRCLELRPDLLKVDHV